tara:strand:- start:9710 stop:10444 length:735 start_codon:yes stop_codon:yes gene_type:complete
MDRFDFDSEGQEQSTKVCISCQQDMGFDNVFSEDAKKEVDITGICEVCFDNTTYPPLFEEAIECRLDYDDIFKMVKSIDGLILAGGVFRYLVDPDEEIKDYDLFFQDRDAVDATQAYLKNLGYEMVFECPEGSLKTYAKGDLPKVQLITKWYYANLSEVISSFDITACCAAWCGESYETHKRFYSDVLNKNIYLNTVQYPVATLNRIIKYVGKGYKLSRTGNLDFITTINSTELDEDHLVFYID